MDTIKLGNKEYEIKFTTYSLSKLKELDLVGMSNELEQGRVFAIIDTLIDLTGALLSSNGVNLSKDKISSLLDEAFNEGVSPVELLEALIKGVTDNPFFKALHQVVK